jgi:hypothetical protein
MKSEMHEFCLRAPIPCGFSDSEGKIQANAIMTELLALNKDAPEMVTLLAEIRTERSPFHMVIKFSSGFNRHSKIWQIDSIPLLSQENGYLGTFFHAHEFLFLSPLEYVDGMPPYFCNFRVTVLPVISGYLPLPRQFARVARSRGCVEQWALKFKNIF